MEKTALKVVSEGAPRSALGLVLKRAGETLFFAGVVILSSFAVMAVAIIAPFILAVSAIIGALTGDRNMKGWRPVSA